MYKKKVGILTFHNADNYGALLQAFALQHYISMSFDYAIEIIDFHTYAHDKEHHRILYKRHNNPIKNLILNCLVARKYKSLRNKKLKFKAFRSGYLTLSKTRYYSENQMQAAGYDYDYLITGSDQVFNPFVPYSKTYFLGFETSPTTKKISYAASFGISSLPGDCRETIKNFLSKFHRISCRESTGVDIVHNLGIENVSLVCDPVFLLDICQWNSILPKSPENEPYIFIYDLNGGGKLIDIAKSINKDAHCTKIICATSNTINHYRGCETRYDVGPLELLSLIANAEYVVTDSFHGTSLSLIFKTKVISYVATVQTSSRLFSLMNTLGILDQLITCEKDFCLPKIRFADYDSKMISFVEQSKCYLRNALS